MRSDRFQRDELCPLRILILDVDNVICVCDGGSGSMRIYTCILV